MLQTLIGPAVLTFHCASMKFRCFLFSPNCVLGLALLHPFSITFSSLHTYFFLGLFLFTPSPSLTHPLSIPFPPLAFANLQISLPLPFYMCYCSDFLFPSFFSLSLSLSSSFCFFVLLLLLFLLLLYTCCSSHVLFLPLLSIHATSHEAKVWRRGCFGNADGERVGAGARTVSSM